MGMYRDRGAGVQSSCSPGDGGNQRRVVAQTHRHRAREREHPLPVGHPPAHARGTASARFAGEGHPQLVAAAAATGPHEAELGLEPVSQALYVFAFDLAFGSGGDSAGWPIRFGDPVVSRV